MTVDDLLTSVSQDSAPPEGLSPELTALWHSRSGNWDLSHEIAQEIDTPFGCWIHAHLHAVEGDASNARYWYRRAGRPALGLEDPDAEWRQLAAEALASG